MKISQEVTSGFIRQFIKTQNLKIIPGPQRVNKFLKLYFAVSFSSLWTKSIACFSKTPIIKFESRNKISSKEYKTMLICAAQWSVKNPQLIAIFPVFKQVVLRSMYAAVKISVNAALVISTVSNRKWSFSSKFLS